jgi:hypothetical protein
MATPKQILLYEALCESLGQEPDDNFEDLSNEQASTYIDELYKIKSEVQ